MQNYESDDKEELGKGGIAWWAEGDDEKELAKGGMVSKVDSDDEEGLVKGGMGSEVDNYDEKKLAKGGMGSMVVSNTKTISDPLSFNFFFANSFIFFWLLSCMQGWTYVMV